MTGEFPVSSRLRTELIDITARVRKIVRDSGVTDGVCVVYVPHTTAAVTINENADPSVVQDLAYVVDNLVPWADGAYRHREGNTAAHVKSSLVGCSETVLVSGGDLVLGTWQGVFFCEFDGPRSRRVIVRVSS